MDIVLRKKLPLEIVEIIMKMVHRMNMEDVNFQIKYCITWVRYQNELSFITSNNFNYYRLLEIEELNEDSQEPSHQLLQRLDS